MEPLLDFCAAILLLTGGFLVILIGLIFVVLVIIEVHDNLKGNDSEKEN